MVRSMTGFGQAVYSDGTYSFSVEIKSVNHRYQETIVRMPREWLRLEDVLKKKVQASVSRGRAEVFVTMERQLTSAMNVEMNWSLAEGYYDAAKQLEERFQLPQGLTVKDILALPDVAHFVEADVASDEWVEEQLLRCTDEALSQLVRMREAEGQHMQVDMLQRLKQLEAHREAMVALMPAAIQTYRVALQKRMEELLAEQSIDEQRIMLEVALLADKANIDEELTRLESHFNQCHQLLAKSGSIGRKLDFLIQEMNREINTIGSKANDIALTNLVVDMKAELEKMREQVQNVE